MNVDDPDNSTLFKLVVDYICEIHQTGAPIPEHLKLVGRDVAERIVASNLSLDDSVRPSGD